MAAVAAPPDAVAPLDRQLPAADERFDGLKVLVAGATGGVGRAVVQQLVAQGVSVRALVRDSVKAVRACVGGGGGAAAGVRAPQRRHAARRHVRAAPRPPCCLPRAWR